MAQIVIHRPAVLAWARGLEAAAQGLRKVWQRRQELRRLQQQTRALSRLDAATLRDLGLEHCVRPAPDLSGVYDRYY